MKTFQIYNVHEKKDFPLLANYINGNKHIIYLDHAATTLKLVLVFEWLQHDQDKLFVYYH